MAKQSTKQIASNRKAFHDYFIEDKYEAGIELAGTEVKSIRLGAVNLRDSFCSVKDGEMFLYGMHISPYEKGNIFNKDPRRTRKLLLHRREIRKLQARVQQDGYSLIPLSLYFSGPRVKVELALARLKPGGKLYVSFILVFAFLIYDLQHGGNIIPDCQNPGSAGLIDAVSAGEDFRNTTGFTHSYEFHQRNILPFMERFGLEKLRFFGQEGILAPNEPQLLERDREEFDQWIALAKKYLELPEFLSWSEHAMYIGRKP